LQSAQQQEVYCSEKSGGQLVLYVSQFYILEVIPRPAETSADDWT